MNCENSTAPIDINNNPTGTCDLKCKFNYKYKESGSKLTNNTFSSIFKSLMRIIKFLYSYNFLPVNTNLILIPVSFKIEIALSKFS